MAYFLGIDIGTYESKGCLIDAGGAVRASLAVPHGMEMPRPGWYEHDADQVWWGDFCRLSRGLIAQSGVPAREIAGVGVSSLSACCLPVDAQGRPLRRAILYGIDARAQEEIAFLNDYYGRDRVIAMKGSEIHSEDVIARMLWVRNKEPGVFARTHKFCNGSTYVIARLTGEYVIDQYLAKTCYFPIYRDDGSVREDMVSPFFDVAQMPRCAGSTEIVGRVTPEAALLSGLAAGTPVTAGTDDAAAEALSAGVLDPGDVMFMLGSSMYMICVIDRPVQEPRLWHSGYLRPGTLTLQGGTNNAGTLTRWMRDQLCPDLAAEAARTGRNAYQLMEALGRDVPPGAEGLMVLPYFAGERTPVNDALASGMMLGLTLRHTRGHIYRALLEAVGYSVAQHIRILEGLGVSLHNVMAVGGGTRNALWMQILADVSGQAFRTPAVTLGAAYGDALLAAVGAGAIPGFEGLRGMFRYDRTYQPEAHSHRLYQDYYRRFEALYPLVRADMHALRALARRG